jgi:4-amino-4-deoxy-L-arabinose transferase-like glycosyltransferase
LKRTTGYLLLIVAAAFLVRIIGLRFGFPYLLHPDEPTAVRRALLIFRDGLNPRWFAMPSFYLYLLHYSFRAHWAVSTLFESPALLPHLRPDPLPYYLIGRVWSVLAGTATVLLIYRIGKKLYSARAGLAAAFLLAVLPLHLLHSHYATVDVPVTFLVTLSFFFSASILSRRKLGYYLAAGAAAGLAAATKYNGLFALFPLLAAHFLRRRERGEKYRRRFFDLFPAAGLAAAGLVFFLASPYALIETRQLYSDLLSQSRYLIHSGHGPIFIATKPGALYNLFYVLYYAGGPVFWLLAVAGVISALWKRQRADWLGLAFAVPYFILISIPVVKFSRFFIPLLPFLALWAGRLLDFRPPRRVPAVALKTAAVLLGLWLGAQAIAYTAVLARRDVRLEAKDWLEENLARPARVGLIKTETGLIFLDDPPLDRNLPELAVEQYDRLLPALARQPHYLVTTDFDYRQILRLKERYDIIRRDLWVGFLSGERGYREIKVFERRPRLFGIDFEGSFPPHDMLYNRPRIAVWEREETREPPQ